MKLKQKLQGLAIRRHLNLGKALRWGGVKSQGYQE